MTSKFAPFTDLLTTIIDNRGRTCPVGSTGIPLIATNCVSNNTLYPSYETTRFVDEETYMNWFRGHPEPGDILFVCKGSPGRTNLVPSPVDFCIAQDMVAVRADPEKINPKYLFAALRSSIVLRQIDNMHVGTLIPHFKKGDFDKLLIPLKDEKEQDQIGEFYFEISRKIDLNRRINQTLEAMAQAIFKSWFVDFDPVKARIAAKQEGRDPLRAAMSAISGKPDAELDTLPREQFDTLAATAALFPEEMEESELGEIPRGWNVADFGAVSTCFDKRRIPLSSREREKKRGSIPYYGATSVMDYVDEAIFDDVYLLLGEDGSVLKPDGTPFVQYIWGKSWVNNHAHVLQGANGVSTEQLMLFIATKNISAYVTGAVQLKLNQKNMNSIPLVKANNEINGRFSAVVGPLFSQHRSLVEEMRSLTELRDTLLPKLLSGEVAVTAPIGSAGAA